MGAAEYQPDHRRYEDLQPEERARHDAAVALLAFKVVHVAPADPLNHNPALFSCAIEDRVCRCCGRGSTGLDITVTHLPTGRTKIFYQAVGRPEHHTLYRRHMDGLTDTQLLQWFEQRRGKKDVRGTSEA